MTNTEITSYEVMFSIRTGVTVMLEKQNAFDAGEDKLAFHATGNDIIVKSPDGDITLCGMKENHVSEACNRGFILFYECEDDEVTRCTHCQIEQ